MVVRTFRDNNYIDNIISTCIIIIIISGNQHSIWSKIAEHKKKKANESNDVLENATDR